MRSTAIIRLAILFAALITLSSCGGGGSSGSSSRVLTYLTDWSSRLTAGQITGLSQRVRLLDLNGGLIATQIVNQDSEGTMSISLGNVSSGTYQLLVELFSQRNAGGTKTGEIRTLVPVSGSTTLRTKVGAPIDSVQVVPDTLTFGVQQSRQFYAGARAATNEMTFVGVADIAWSTLGGVSTVNSEGIVAGQSQGTGSVRATHVPTGKLGAAPITITPFTAETSKWVVLVYLNAANDLYQFSNLNMNQMERVANQAGNLRFVVQWKQSKSLFPDSLFDGTRRYLVKPDNTSSIQSELIQDMGRNVDMGDKDTLTEFINWAKTYYPGQRYALVVWNHGNGWRRGLDRPAPTRGVSYDDETGNSINTWEMASALGANTFDIVAWDASLMQMFEVAYEIQDQTDYVIGSEESPPGEGYPYDTIFAAFRDNPDAPTRTLTKSFVDGMLGVPAYATRKITQSVLDTSRFVALKNSLSVFADELRNNSAQLTTIVPNVRANAQSYSPDGVRFYRDLYDICLRLEANVSTPGTVALAAVDLRAALNSTIVWEGHNANSPNSHGLSIDFSASDRFIGQTATDYGLLRLARESTWDEWLRVAP